jgi:hypothetical protein
MWNLEPNERLREWKQFRERINQLTIDVAIRETVHLWSYAPYVTRYLERFNSSDWPDPWKLLYDNSYCDLAKALGMLYTLYLSDHQDRSFTDLEIRVYKNMSDNDILNTVWVDDGKYILNFTFDTVVNKDLITENYIQLCSHSIQTLKHKF